MAPGLLHAVDRELANLAAELKQFFAAQEPKVARLLHAVKHGHVAILAAVFDLSKRVVILTGATGNIGPTVLRAYLEQGAHVAIPVRDEAKGAALRSSLGDLAGTSEDPRVFAHVADPSDRPAVDAFVEQVLRAWGRLDIVANLIGGYASSDAATGDLASYRTYWDQKVATIVTATAACLRPMRARGYGRVVNVASIAALKGEKGAAGYAMANAALLRWSESLAEEVKREGITVNCVLPRIIDNAANRAAMPKADPSRWATAGEIAAVVVFLSSDEASGLTGAAVQVTART